MVRRLSCRIQQNFGSHFSLSGNYFLSTSILSVYIIAHNAHLQDFLNGVCTHMMVMQQQKLKYWSGNYDQVNTYLYQILLKLVIN